MPRKYWMLVISPENFLLTRERGLTIQGLQTTLQRKAERVEAGDRMLFYLSGAKRFAATVTVTSKFFEDHSPVWKGHKENEDFPYRVHMEPAVILEEDEFLDVLHIGPRMEYVKKWVPEWWHLAFQGDLHIIPRRDFSLIEEEMKKVVAARAKG